jgi:hypothetical protein
VSATRTRIAVVTGPLLLYLASLVLPVVNDITGAYALLGGFFAFVLRDAWGAVWIANFAFGAALLLTFARPRLARWLALAAVVVASPSFMIHRIIANEGGGTTRATLSVGFYLWYAAFVVLTVLLFAAGRALRSPDRALPADARGVDGARS